MCLEKDPNRRPRSAQDLARRLEALADIPVFCRDQAAQWWETNLPDPSVLLYSDTPAPIAATASAERVRA
jgi:hypothetical protein